MDNKRTLCVADIHGNYIGLRQCLERSNFNPIDDRIIFLGDLVDRYPDSKKIIDLIIDEVPNKIVIRGNHDEWFRFFLNINKKSLDEGQDYTLVESVWAFQGGKETLESYGLELERSSVNGNYQVKTVDIDQSHLDLFNNANLFHIEDNKAFVHGGLHLNDIHFVSDFDYYWDREFWFKARTTSLRNLPEHQISEVFKTFDKIFIGHSIVHDSEHNPEAKPVKALNVWNLDTGGGSKGKITIMDIDTDEYWQSDFVTELY